MEDFPATEDHKDLFPLNANDVVVIALVSSVQDVARLVFGCCPSADVGRAKLAAAFASLLLMLLMFGGFRLVCRVFAGHLASRQ